MTFGFGNMYTCYIFMVYGLLSIIRVFAPYQSTLLYYNNWIQLWSLPLLLTGQNLMGRASEQRDIEMYNMIKEEFDIVREQQANANQERQELKDLLQQTTEENANIKTILADMQELLNK